MTEEIEENVQCKLCDYRGETTQLIQHRLHRHSKHCKFMCYACADLFTSYESVKKHEETHNLQYVCQICRTEELVYSFQTLQSFNNHTCNRKTYPAEDSSECELNTDSHQCPTCDVRCVSREELQTHAEGCKTSTSEIVVPKSQSEASCSNSASMIATSPLLVGMPSGWQKSLEVMCAIDEIMLRLTEKTRATSQTLQASIEQTSSLNRPTELSPEMTFLKKQALQRATELTEAVNKSMLGEMAPELDPLRRVTEMTGAVQKLLLTVTEMSSRANEPIVGSEEITSLVNELKVGAAKINFLVNELMVESAEMTSPVNEPMVGSAEMTSPVNEPMVASAEMTSPVNEHTMASSEMTLTVDPLQRATEMTAAVQELLSILPQISPPVQHGGFGGKNSCSE